MEQQQADPAVAESVSTSAEAEPTGSTVESQPTQSDPFASPWDKFGQDTGGDETVNESKAGEEKAEAKPEPKEETPADTKDEEKPLEDEALEELFSTEKTEEDNKESKSEKTPEEELDSQNPEEMAKAQRNKTARAYLERTEKYAQPLKDFRYDKVEPKELFASLEPLLGAEKITALKQSAAHDLVDTNPDATFQRAYAVKMLAKDPNWKPDPAAIPSLDDIIAGGMPTARGDAALPDTQGVDLSEITKGLESTIDWDWRNADLDDRFVDDRELSLAKALRAMEDKAKTATAEAEAAKAKATEAETARVTETQTKEQKELYDSLNTKIKDFRSTANEKLLPFIAKNTGLEVSKDDTSEIAAYKDRKMQLYKGTDYERANNLPSQFETFLENESSVKGEVAEVYGRIVDALLAASKAEKAGDKAKMERHLAEANDERVPFYTLLAKANEEFKAVHITPELQILGKSWAKQAESINKEARERVEPVSNAAPTHRPVKRDHKTADDVWASMGEDAAREERLAAGA